MTTDDRMLSIDALTRSLYEELRKIARRSRLQAGRPQTLQTTALIHESYVKLSTVGTWNSREHFLGVAATAMRHLLVDAARARLARKRGGSETHVDLDDAVVAIDAQDTDVLDVDAALSRLAQLDPRLARVVECRFFAGYSEAETGAILGISDRTVRRDWLQAKAWLFKELQGSEPSPPP